MIEILGIIFGFGILVIWHELGHLLAALSVKIKPSVFSVGFGKRIWGFNLNGLDFRISLIPLGGYVKFEDEGPTGIPQRFFELPLWARLWIVFAGPLFSFILGPILAFFISLYNGETSIFTTTVYSSKSNLFQKGDSIISINGKTPKSGEEAIDLLKWKGEKTVEILRDGKFITLKLEGDYSDSIELRIPPIVGSTVKGFPAHDILKKWDVVIKVDTVEVFSWQDLVSYVQSREEGDTVELEILRDGEVLLFRIPVKYEGGKGKLGIYVGYRKKWPPSFAKVIEGTLFLTKKFSLIIFDGLKKLVSGETKVEESVGGPIAIGAIMASAASSGLDVWLSILIVITINLAIINLLPIPGLDGGHILYMIVDEIYYRLSGMRIPEKASSAALMIGILIIISIAIFAIGLDIKRLITGKLWNMIK
jgi:RIP metalloprotease RseP